MGFAFHPLAAREQQGRQLICRPEKVWVAPHDPPQHGFNRRAGLAVFASATIKKDQPFKMFRRLLQRLHRAQLGQRGIAFFERNLAFLHQRIDTRLGLRAGIFFFLSGHGGGFVERLRGQFTVCAAPV